MNLQKRKIIPGCEESMLKGNEVGCLLIHGFRSCSFEMKEFGQYLNELGFTVNICLLPGHGTQPEDLIDKKWEHWARAVENSYFDLRKKCKKIFIAGLSTGGSLALYLTSKHKVDGVIALAPGLFLRHRYAKLSHFLKYIWKYKKIKSGPDISINVESKVYPKVPVSSVSELLSLFSALKTKLKSIIAPALIIYSINDHVVKPQSALTIYNKISSKKKKIIKLEKSYHILTMDIEKQKVFHETGKFIKEILSL
jgi:carboxylesterase